MNEEVETTEAAISGALDIIAEQVSDSPKYRSYILKVFKVDGVIESKEKRNAVDEQGIFEMYYDYTEKVEVHMEYIGHPLVGDPVYRIGVGQMRGALTRLTDGQLLHAKEIHFKHPISNQLMSFEVPLPEHFEDILRTLTPLE